MWKYCGSELWKGIVEVVCVRSLQDDKFVGKPLTFKRVNKIVGKYCRSEL